MRVFITGATGLVGSSVVKECIQAGHEVIGLARSEVSAKSLRETGATVYRGDLEDLKSIKDGASNSDGVIHTGMIHDFSNFKACCEIDRKVIMAIGDALSGSSRPFIVTSAIGIMSGKNLITEETMPPPASSNPRLATEEACQALIQQGVNVSVVRLPPSVHGDGDHGFVPILIKIARDKGLSAYFAEEKNVWSAVHKLDAARVFRLALEKGVRGAYYHAVADEGVAFREIAQTIGEKLNVPVVSKTAEEAKAHFAWFAHFAAMNVLASSKKTQADLHWQPKHIGLVADLRNGTYFR